MPPLLAVAATLVHAVNAFINRAASSGQATYFAMAAASTIAIIPYTLIFLQPTSKELFRREEGARGKTAGVEGSTVELVRKWGRINLVRAFLPAIGAVIAMAAL